MKKEHRICILGGPGSGKSTLAKELGKSLKIPVFHLDRELLTKNFEKFPDEVVDKKHKAIIDKNSWVIDGNYKSIFEDRLQKATHIIFISVGRIKTVPRAVKRAAGPGQYKDAVPDGVNCNRFSWEFLRHMLRYSRKKRIKWLSEICIGAKTELIVVKSKQIDEMVKEIGKKLT